MAQPDVFLTNPPGGTRISDDQRNVLKEKTGFEDYTAYLEDHNKVHPGYGPLLKAWREFRAFPTIYPPSRNDCDILDLTRDENSLIRVNLCCQTGSNCELFTVLSEPQKGVFGRIVIWRTPKRHLNDTSFLEDLGLALKIDPTFVKSLYTKSTHYHLRLTHIPVLVASHVMVGDRIATMTRCCINEKSSAVPIVLIADATDHIREEEWVERRRFDRRRFDPIFQEPKSARRSGTSEYQEMIMAIFERNSAFSEPESADALILPALLAVMHMDAYNLRASCDYMIPNSTRPDRTHHTHWDSIEPMSVDWKESIHCAHWGALEPMSADCNELRRRIVEFEDVIQDALTGFKLLYGADWSQDYKCESTVEYFTETINRARRIEAYVRDSCQMRFGWFSFAKSKESIGLSRTQIEEGKRVKIFTVLAFIYIPLNLASSIFGMNIQQLNNSGQPIQTYLVTALVILLLTGGSWLCTEQINEYRTWILAMTDTYSIAVRVRLLIWLYCHGYWTWVRKTKAWWYILKNSELYANDGFGSTLPDVIRSSDRDSSAIFYVSMYMNTLIVRDRAFSLDWRNGKKVETP